MRVDCRPQKGTVKGVSAMRCGSPKPHSVDRRIGIITQVRTDEQHRLLYKDMKVVVCHCVLP